MAKPAALTLLCPGLLGPVPLTLGQAIEAVGPLPNLQWLLAHARQRPLPAGSGEAMVQGLTGDSAAMAGLLSARAGVTGAGQVYRAAPVHLRADRDRLLLFSGDAAALTPDEAQQIATDFNRLFTEDKLTLYPIDGEWILQSSAPIGPDLPALSTVAGRYLDTVLPRDAANQDWRRLLNEAQMFLFDHPVNQARESRGVMPANGLWFWDGGTPFATPASHLNVDYVMGQSVLAQGLAAWADCSLLQTLDMSAMSLKNHQIWVVWEEAERALHSGDAQGWIAALQRFETLWAAPVRDWVSTAGLQVSLCPGNGKRYVLSRAARWRFWARAQPLSRAVQTQ